MTEHAKPTPRPWAEMAEPPSPPPPDAGDAILDQLQEQLMMDEHWIDRGDRRLTWWGGPLPIVISVAEPRLSFGDPTIKVTATCTILESTRIDFEDACALLSGLNTVNAGTSLWVDPADGSLHGTVTHYAHDGNQAVLDNRIFALLILMNYGNSLGKAEHLEEMLDGTQPTIAHPESGLRTDYDELTSYPEFVAMEGNKANRWKDAGLDMAADWFRTQGFLTNDGATGLTTELPYSSAVPAAEQAALGLTRDGLTALYQQILDEPHPFAGQGLLSLLRLPDRPDEIEVPTLANGLNWAEANQLTGFPAWGAWTATPDGDGLAHALFCPSVMARPGLSMTIGFYSALRVLWAQERLLSSDLVDQVRRGNR